METGVLPFLGSPLIHGVLQADAEMWYAVALDL